MKKLAIIITLLLTIATPPILNSGPTRYPQTIVELPLIPIPSHTTANRIEDSWLKASREDVNLTQTTSTHWLKLESEHFTIAYQPGYEGDAIKILEFAIHAHETIGPKFSYKPDKKTTIYIFLKPGVDRAPHSWWSMSASPTEAEIYLLSPSEAIKVHLFLDDEWFLRNVVHEYAHVVVRRSRYLAIGYWDYFLQDWIDEGLAEYFAIFHSTPNIRRRESHQIFVDLSFIIHEGYGYIQVITAEIYGRSAYIGKYLYDTLGDENVAKLLWSKAPTFHEALKKELNLSIREFEENFLKWACEEVGADYDKLYGEAHRRIRPPSERIVLSPSVGPPGTVVNINGFGFVGNTSGTVWIDTNHNRLIDVSESSASVTTFDTGTFTTTLTLPPVDPDLYYIRVDIPLGLPVESSATFTVPPSVLKPQNPYIITGERSPRGFSEFLETIRRLAGPGGSLGGYPLVKAVEMYITEIRGRNSIFIIDASSVNDLKALKELDEKYPYLLPLPYEELRYYPLPLVCFAMQRPTRAVRGIIIAEGVSGSLAKLLADIGVPPGVPVREEGGKFKPLERVRTPWGPEPLPRITALATPSSITRGASATLSWSSTNATSISVSPSIGISPLPLSGSATVSPTTTTTYVFTATGPGGTAETRVTLTVTEPPTPLPTITASISPSSIVRGGSSTLSWSSTNTSLVTVTPSIGISPLPLSGSATVSPTTTTTYVFTATGPGGTATASTTLTVTDPPPAPLPTVTASVSPASIERGKTATLTWSSTNATSVTVTPSIGISPLPLSGSATVSPTTTTTYVFTATSPGGTSEERVTLTVTEPPPPPLYRTVELRIGSTIYKVDGITQTMDAAPYVEEGRTMIPVRFLVEGLGGTVGWDSNNTKTVTVRFTKPTVEIKLIIGNPTATVNGIKVPIDPNNTKVVPVIKNNRTFVPLRFLVEQITGSSIDWIPPDTVIMKLLR